MSGSFTAQIDKWVLQTNQRIEAVVKQSAQDVIEDMNAPVGKGGNMPVDTGFLRASLDVNLNGPVPASRENPGGQFDFNISSAAVTIAGARLGQTIWATYGANYAGHVHYGANGRPGRQFVTLAAQKWQSIVSRNAARLKSSVLSRRS